MQRRKDGMSEADENLDCQSSAQVDLRLRHFPFANPVSLRCVWDLAAVQVPGSVLRRSFVSTPKPAACGTVPRGMPGLHVIQETLH